MSLQVWLPLNSTKNQQNGSNPAIFSGGPYQWADGPYGNAAKFQINKNNKITCPSTDFNYIKRDFSYCLVLQKNYAHKDSSVGYMWAFTCGRADAGGRGYGLQILSTSQVRFWFGTSNWTIDHADDVFHSYAFVKRATNIKIYQDGVLKVDTTFSGTYPTYSDGGGVGIGVFHYASDDIYPLWGVVTDFRIYDHALSDREVRDVYLYPLLHYKFDSTEYSLLRQMYTGEAALGSMSGSFGKTALSDGYRYTYTYTGTGSDIWPNIKTPGLAKSDFQVGQKYVWSCKCRVNKWTGAGSEFKMRASMWENDYQTASDAVLVANPSKVDGQWHEYYVVKTITQANYDSTSPQFSPRIEFYTSSLKTSGTVYDFSIDIKELQIVKAESFQGWIDNNYNIQWKIPNNGLIIDGNLDIWGNPGNTTCVPSAQFMRAINFNGRCYFKNTSLPLSLYSFTVAFWFNLSANANQHFIFGSFDSWPNNGLGIYRDPNKNYFEVLVRPSTASTYVSFNTSSYPTTLGTWHHFALTWDGSNLRWYLDSSLKITKACTGAPCLFKNIYIGNSLYQSAPSSEIEEAYLSDFRLYNQCLSASDVTAMYRTKASIDNRQNVHSACFSETYDRNTSITNTGMFNAKNQWHEDVTITANGTSSYTPGAGVTNSCSSNIVILLNKNDTSVTNFQGRKYRMVFDVTWSNCGYTSGGSTWFQGAVNDAWDGSNAFVAAANNVRNMRDNVTSASGTYHYDTIVTIDRENKYKYLFQFRTDNSNGNGSMSITNFYVYELDSSLTASESRFSNMLEY